MNDEHSVCVTTAEDLNRVISELLDRGVMSLDIYPGDDFPGVVIVWEENRDNVW